MMPTTTNMANPCNICGDTGVFEAIITCCECKISRQHLYCMRVVTTEAPLFWFCEECERKKLFSPTKSNKEHIHVEALTPKVSTLISKNPRILKCPKKTAFASRFNFKEKRVHTGRTKYISCEEAVKLSSGANKSEQPSKNAFNSKHGSPKSKAPPREKSLSKIYDNTKFEPQFQQPVAQKSTGVKDSIKSPKSSVRAERTNTERFSARIEVPKSCKKVEKTITQESIKMAKSEILPLSKEEADMKVPKSPKKVENTNMKKEGGNENLANRITEEPVLISKGPLSEMHDSSIPALHSYWKGSFYLPNEHENLNGAFKAHPPSIVHSKVYETLHKMPENLHFELLQVDQVLVDLFQGDCPYKDDIGLYFFPRFKERDEKCSSLIEFLWSKKLVMKSFVDEVELFVFSSRFLQLLSQEFEGKYFLWGVFRSNKVKKNEKGASMIMHGSCGQSQRSTCDEFPPGFEKIQKPPLQG